MQHDQVHEIILYKEKLENFVIRFASNIPPRFDGAA